MMKAFAKHFTEHKCCISARFGCVVSANALDFVLVWPLFAVLWLRLYLSTWLGMELATDQRLLFLA